jgi:proteasome lid subunit RPN8/RPN11
MTKLVVPRSILDDTAASLCDPEGERTVLWQVAAEPATEARVSRLVVPAQRAIKSADGCAVHVNGSELARIQFEAHDLGLLTSVQLHTHPGKDVAMSDLDVAWAIADFPGAVSIIVPRFGALGLIGWPGVSAYTRHKDGWSAWSDRQLLDSIRLDK